MSLRPHRVDVLKYSKDVNLYFIKYDSKISHFLIDEEVMYESENYPFEFELDIEKLKEVVQNYENKKKGYYEWLDKETKDEIEENDAIEAFKKEIEYAEKHNEKFLNYHIF